MESPTGDVNLELIEVIYETVLDEGFWPDILNGLAMEIDRLDPTPILLPDEPNLIHEDSIREQHLIKRLAPFFKQALELNRQYTSALSKNEALESLLNNVPFGIVLIDNHFNVISTNRCARKIFRHNSGIALQNEKLTFSNSRSFALIKSHLDTKKHTGVQKLLLSNDRDKTVLSILISPYDTSSLNSAVRYYSIFIASTETKVRVSHHALKAEYKISQAEASLLNALINGESIADYAGKTGLSENTLRYQLRSIFKKTKVKRLPQLVKLILTSPSYFFQIDDSETTIGKSYQEFDGEDASLILKDGRRMVYSLDGNPNGFPVIFIHGKYGCRLLKHPDKNITREADTQVIVPDRPGYGMSDPCPDPSFLAWTEDFEQLLDHLNVDRCSIISLEVGAAYAAACAYKLPHRIHKVILCNGYAPKMKLSDFSGSVPVERLFFALAKYTPSLFRDFTELRFKGMTRDLTWYYEKLGKYLPECDRSLLDRRDFLEMLHKNGIEALRNPTGFINDTINVCKDWGFSLQDIQVDFELWHGEQNRNVPLAIGKKLAKALPQVKAHYLPTQGHFLPIPFWNILLLCARDHIEPEFLCWLHEKNTIPQG